MFDIMFANACINLCAPSLFHCIKMMDLHPQFAPECKPFPATSNFKPSFYKTKLWQDYGIYHDQNPALWYMSPFIWNLSDRT